MDLPRTVISLSMLLRESRPQVELILADLYAAGIDVIIYAENGECYYRVNPDAPNGEIDEEETA